MGWTLNILRCYWKLLIVVLTPVFLLPLPAVYGDTREIRCAYVILIMTIFWATEAIPLHITALIPLFAFPLLGIMPSNEVCVQYFLDPMVLLVGSLWLSYVIDASGLSKRIAFYILIKIGFSPRILMAVFMALTTLLSIWVNDTSATAFLLPVVDALMEELDDIYKKCKSRRRLVIPQITITDIEGNKKTCIGGELNEGFVEDDLDLIRVVKQPELIDNTIYVYEEDDATKKKDVFTVKTLRRSFYLAVAFSATIAGTGFVSGSPTNLVLIRLLNKTYSEPTEVNFVSWMAVNIPLMLICLVVTWVWLQYLFFGLRRDKSFDSKESEKEHIIKTSLKNTYKSLGRPSFHEGVTLILVLLLMMLWVLRKPGNGYGWGSFLENMYGSNLEVSDGSAVMLVAFIMFLIPANLPEIFDSATSDPVSGYGCLSWSNTASTTPWGLLFLLGGLHAIAEGVKSSGLIVWLAQWFGKTYNSAPLPLLLVLKTFFANCITNIVPSYSAASFALPVLNDMALANCSNPLYFLLPVSVSCSYGFILPVSTFPNAIVYYTSNIKLLDMIKAGAGLSIFCILLINIIFNTLGETIFNLNSMPAWINSTTVTLPAC